MKKSMLAGVAVLGLSMFAGFSYAADDAKSEKITGVLIDQACGGKQMSKDDPEKATAYLKDSNATKVTVEGTKDGDMLKVTSIKAAE